MKRHLRRLRLAWQVFRHQRVLIRLEHVWTGTSGTNPAKATCMNCGDRMGTIQVCRMATGKVVSREGEQ